jgi:hypothetical protein
VHHRDRPQVRWGVGQGGDRGADARGAGQAGSSWRSAALRQTSLYISER